MSEGANKGPTIEDIVKRHRELTAEQAIIMARHAQELEPYKKKIEQLENAILFMMQRDGVESYKTAFGTAYQSRLRSVKMEDPVAFRDYILEPAAQQIANMVAARGGQPPQSGDDVRTILNLIAHVSLWDLADFRPGKKGITEYMKETSKTVPGVTINEIININVRGS